MTTEAKAVKSWTQYHSYRKLGCFRLTAMSLPLLRQT